MTELDRGGERANPGAHQPDGAAGARDVDAPNAQVAAVLRAPREGGLPPGVGRAQLLFIQRTAGNRAAQSLLGSNAVTVQRKGPSVSGLKRAVGLGKKAPTAAAKAEQVGAKAKSAPIVTVSDLDTQVSTLEAATRKLVKAHQPGDTASHMAAFQVNAAAQRIRGNLPDQNSKASKLLGRTYPDQVRKLRWIVGETQLILDEVRVANTRREAQNVYLEAGRADASQPGALTKLGGRNQFNASSDGPAPNAEVLAILKAKGFATYGEALEDAFAKSAVDPRAEDEGNLKRAQPELFTHAERSRSRASAQTMGLSAAELAAIQTYSGNDYRYINPATANDPAWLAKNFPSLVDKPDKTLEDWADLQDELAAGGQNLDQRIAERRGELTALREEGGLHAGVALQGLLKMPVWKGTAYRGERITSQRFYPRFVKKGDTFAPREPTFTWKTITSISKSEGRAASFSTMGEGAYSVIFEFDIINGRDIEGMSLARLEREVALLPGAEFAYGPY